MEIIGYPFVNHVDQNLRPSINNGKEYLKNVFNNSSHSQIDNLQKYGFIKIMGYRYNFKPLLKTYLYKQHGSWFEVYAPNKTLLRKSIYGRIDKIVEL